MYGMELWITLCWWFIYCCDYFQWLNIHTSFNKNELFGIEDIKEGTYWYMNNQNFAVYSGNRLKSEVYSACVMLSKRTVMMLWWIRIRIERWSSVNLWQPRLASSLHLWKQTIIACQLIPPGVIRISVGRFFTYKNYATLWPFLIIQL